MLSTLSGVGESSGVGETGAITSSSVGEEVRSAIELLQGGQAGAAVSALLAARSALGAG